MSRTKRRDVLVSLVSLSSGAVAWIPLAIAVCGYGLALIVAPEFESLAQHERWSAFFGTAAQVTATLLLVLALEARFVIVTPVFSRPWAALATVGYVALAIVAAGLGMSPSLPNWLSVQVFALTVAGGIAALLSVVLIGAHALASAYSEQERKINEEVAKRLKELGPPGDQPR